MIHYGRVSRVLITKDYRKEEHVLDDKTITTSLSMMTGWPESWHETYEVKYSNETTETRWIDIKTADIQINTDYSAPKYPYNITKWEDLYDIDITIESPKDGQKKTTVKIYNPPDEWKIFAQFGFHVEEVGWKKIKKDMDAFQNIMLQSGYMNENGVENLKPIFIGTIDNVKFSSEGNETTLTFEAISDTEKRNELDSSIRIPIGSTLNYAVKLLASKCNVTIGRLVTRAENEEIELQCRYIFEKDTSIKEAVSKILKKEKLTVSLEDEQRRIDPGLRVDYNNGYISVTPDDWEIKTGFKFNYDSGLVSISQKKGENNSKDEWEIKTVFLPEIALQNSIIAQIGYNSDGLKKYSYFNVIDYSHDIPSDDSASTTMTCRQLEGDEE